MFIRPVFISADLFWGFQRYVDLNKYSSTEEVVNYILKELRDFRGENMQSLVERLDDRIRTSGFHIENTTNYNSLLVYSNDPLCMLSLI